MPSRSLSTLDLSSCMLAWMSGFFSCCLTCCIVIWTFYRSKGSDLETFFGDRSSLVVQSIHRATPMATQSEARPKTRTSEQ